MIHQKDIDLVARFSAESIMHTAAPASGSTALAAAATIPGTVPNRTVVEGNLKSGRGGIFTFGHPSGAFSGTSRPVLNRDPNNIRFTRLSLARTARIICNGMVSIKNNRPLKHPALKEEITAASLFLNADDVSVQR